MDEVVCGWRVGDAVCIIRDSWHAGAHHLVSVYELEATA